MLRNLFVAVLERLRRRYAGRGKAGKGRLLDEFCEHHGSYRKYAIKLLHAGPPPPERGPRPGPEPKYESAQDVVERIWPCAEQVCGKRLAPALDLWLPHYARHDGALLPTQKNSWARSAPPRWTGCWRRPRRTRPAD